MLLFSSLSKKSMVFSDRFCPDALARSDHVFDGVVLLSLVLSTVSQSALDNHLSMQTLRVLASNKGIYCCRN